MGSEMCIRDSSHNRRGGNGGGRGGTPGGGSGSRTRPTFGRGSRGGGRSFGRGRGGRRDGAMGRSTGHSSSFSSSSVSSSDRGEVNVVTGKRQATLSLVDVATSAEKVSKLTVSGDRAMPVSSCLAHARADAIAAADAAADARHEASVSRANVTLGLKEVARIATPPFPASVNKAAGAQQLTRSVKAAMTDILMRSDDRCIAGLNLPRGFPAGTSPCIKRSCMQSPLTSPRPPT